MLKITNMMSQETDLMPLEPGMLMFISDIQ